ncbi:hypothetical protein L6258_00100, partial [Candidatus Parcubacteria bacterium]|nr:hypothetical protein [Candidatus Parcubacteria bacterium]
MFHLPKPNLSSLRKNWKRLVGSLIFLILLPPLVYGALTIQNTLKKASSPPLIVQNGSFERVTKGFSPLQSVQQLVSNLFSQFQQAVTTPPGMESEPEDGEGLTKFSEEMRRGRSLEAEEGPSVGAPPRPQAGIATGWSEVDKGGDPNLFELSSEQRHEGSYSQKVQVDQVGEGITQALSLDPTRNWEVTAWVYVERGRATVGLYNDSGFDDFKFSQKTGEWEELKFRVLSIQGIPNRLSVTAYESNAVFWLDTLSIEYFELPPPTEEQNLLINDVTWGEGNEGVLGWDSDTGDLSAIRGASTMPVHIYVSKQFRQAIPDFENLILTQLAQVNRSFAELGVSFSLAEGLFEWDQHNSGGVGDKPRIYSTHPLDEPYVFYLLDVSPDFGGAFADVVNSSITIGGRNFTEAPTILAHEMGHLFGAIDMYFFKIDYNRIISEALWEHLFGNSLMNGGRGLHFCWWTKELLIQSGLKVPASANEAFRRQPSTNAIRLVGPDGNALSGAAVKIYFRQGTCEVVGSFAIERQIIDFPAEYEGIADAAGEFIIGPSPFPQDFSGVQGASHCVAFVTAERDSRLYYGWFSIFDTTSAGWRGVTESAIFPIEMVLQQFSGERGTLTGEFDVINPAGVAIQRKWVEACEVHTGDCFESSFDPSYFYNYQLEDLPAGNYKLTGYAESDAYGGVMVSDTLPGWDPGQEDTHFYLELELPVWDFRGSLHIENPDNRLISDFWVQVTDSNDEDYVSETKDVSSAESEVVEYWSLPSVPKCQPCFYTVISAVRLVTNEVIHGVPVELPLVSGRENLVLGVELGDAGSDFPCPGGPSCRFSAVLDVVGEKIGDSLGIGYRIRGSDLPYKAEGWNWGVWLRGDLDFSKMPVCCGYEHEVFAFTQDGGQEYRTPLQTVTCPQAQLSDCTPELQFNVEIGEDPPPEEPPFCTPLWQCQDPLDCYEEEVNCPELELVDRYNNDCCPCIPSWHCREPLDCFEADLNECGEEDQYNNDCCPCIPSWQCRTPSDCYEEDTNECGSPDQYKESCCPPKTCQDTPENLCRNMTQTCVGTWECPDGYYCDSVSDYCGNAASTAGKCCPKPPPEVVPVPKYSVDLGVRNITKGETGFGVGQLTVDPGDLLEFKFNFRNTSVGPEFGQSIWVDLQGYEGGFEYVPEGSSYGCSLDSSSGMWRCAYDPQRSEFHDFHRYNSGQGTPMAKGAEIARVFQMRVKDQAPAPPNTSLEITTSIRGFVDDLKVTYPSCHCPTDTCIDLGDQ